MPGADFCVEEIDFVQEEDYRGAREPATVDDVVEEDEGFFHLVLEVVVLAAGLELV